MKSDRLNPASQAPVDSQVIVNNSVNQPPPGTPLSGGLLTFDRRARVLGHAARPLLLLARFGTNKQLTKNKSLWVTPFWHNDTPSRVTVTFGARRSLSARCT